MISKSSRHIISCKGFQPGRLGFPGACNVPKIKADRSISSSSSSMALSSSLSSRAPCSLSSLLSSPWHRTHHVSDTFKFEFDLHSNVHLMNAHSNSKSKSNRTLAIAIRSYFTNGAETKKDDPYAILGLQWGDGATTADIRQAFRERAKALHPDVVDTSVMTTERAQQEFQKLVAAYEALLKHVQADDCETVEEWRVALWRQSDRIAMDRTDVAGVARKRPAKPAQTAQRKRYGREIGHPSGRGAAPRGEYLGNGKKPKTKPKSEYIEWQPSQNTHKKRLR